jgi:hypothetical protein
VADRYCGNCGHELGPDDQFCRNCGRPALQAARVPTPEADVSVPPPPPEARETSERTFLRKWWPLIALLVVAALYIASPPSGGGGGSGGGSKHHTPNNASHKQVIERGEAAREREQNPKPGHAPLPKGDTLEVYYKTTGGAGYEAYAGADGITQPVDFTGPHYGDEHILYHADHNPGMTIDVTRMTTSGTVEVTVVHDGKQIAHAVADDSNHNVYITGPPHDLIVQ